MEFLATPTSAPPKNLYPCLATISLTPHGTEQRARRRSSSSFISNDDDNALRRVISGGRRRSSAGLDQTGATEQHPGESTFGRWYWRVQAGAADVSTDVVELTTLHNVLWKAWHVY